MAKDNLVKLLTISFEICQSDLYSRSSQPVLKFKSSNYNLSEDEILRAKLMPDKLTLDNKIAYVKSTEDAYCNRSGENMLKVNYNKLG